MEWFKFYGKDWLTDIKILNMSIEDRLCYLTLLCLASASEEQGIIKNCKEESVLKLTQLYEDPYDSDNEWTRAKGFLKRLNDNKMITIDNKQNVTVTAFLKRQSINLSGYERVKRYREKQKTLINKGLNRNDNNDNVNDNTMITLDKIRIDKNRINNSGNLLTNIESIMYNYCDIDEDGNPILKKKGLKRISKEENTELIKVGLLWRKMCSKYLEVNESEVVMKNIYYPIRALYAREKFNKEDFERLFKYFFNDKNIKQEDKMGFDLCMSEKYVAKYKIAKRSADKPISNAQIAESIRL